jgi:NADPH:quinone reductase-like Zn-dependent oxidoreductase
MPTGLDVCEKLWVSPQVDALLDGVGGALGTEAFGLVADGGRVSAHGAASGGPAARGAARLLAGVCGVPAADAH